MRKVRRLPALNWDKRLSGGSPAAQGAARKVGTVVELAASTGEIESTRCCEGDGLCHGFLIDRPLERG